MITKVILSIAAMIILILLLRQANAQLKVANDKNLLQQQVISLSSIDLKKFLNFDDKKNGGRTESTGRLSENRKTSFFSYGDEEKFKSKDKFINHFRDGLRADVLVESDGAAVNSGSAKWLREKEWEAGSVQKRTTTEKTPTERQWYLEKPFPKKSFQQQKQTIGTDIDPGTRISSRLLAPINETILLRETTTNNRLGDMCDRCIKEVYLAHYYQRGCKAIQSRECDCAKYFKCPPIEAKSESSSSLDNNDRTIENRKCHFKDRSYQIGEQISVPEEPCRFCRCRTRRFNNGTVTKTYGEIDCNFQVECPETVFGVRPQANCYFAYSADKCCGTEICPQTPSSNNKDKEIGWNKNKLKNNKEREEGETSSVNQWSKEYNANSTITCRYRGKIFRWGEIITPEENLCRKCYCDATWNEFDPPSSASCVQRQCLTLLNKNFIQKCTPIYRIDGCCPIEYICPEKNLFYDPDSTVSSDQSKFILPSDKDWLSSSSEETEKDESNNSDDKVIEKVYKSIYTFVSSSFLSSSSSTSSSSPSPLPSFSSTSPKLDATNSCHLLGTTYRLGEKRYIEKKETFYGRTCANCECAVPPMLTCKADFRCKNKNL